MQIDCIEVFHIALPFGRPLKTAAGQFESLQTVLVRMQSGEVSGWGEASPGNAPIAGADWAAGAFLCLRDWLAPLVSGTAVESAEDLARRLEAFHGHRFAKAALDMAWWDLEARREEKPLHQLLGGRREAIEVGATLDQMDSIDDFLAAVGASLEAGFARLKLKVRPGWDLYMLDTVRKEFPTAALYADCEAGMRLEQMELLCRFDDFGLDTIEQPLPAGDLIGHAMVQETIQTSICLDESITTVDEAELAVELKSCRIMNLKPGRTGGLTPCLAILDEHAGEEMSFYAGAAPQSAVGTRFGFALAAVEKCSLPADFFPADRVLGRDLAAPLLPAADPTDGKMRVALWDEPGIGIAPDADVLKDSCISKAVITANQGEQSHD